MDTDSLVAPPPVLTAHSHNNHLPIFPTLLRTLHMTYIHTKWGHAVFHEKLRWSWSDILPFKDLYTLHTMTSTPPNVWLPNVVLFGCVNVNVSRLCTVSTLSLDTEVWGFIHVNHVWSRPHSSSPPPPPPPPSIPLIIIRYIRPLNIPMHVYRCSPLHIQ